MRDNLDTKNGMLCFDMMFNLRHVMPKEWPPEAFWHTWLVSAGVDVVKSRRPEGWKGADIA